MTVKTKYQKKEVLYLINEDIPFFDIVLINTVTGERENITKTEALKRAEETGLDLVCVSPKQVPPVCKLDNYQKLVYRQSKKKKKDSDKKMKKITFRFNINENDLVIKIERICNWVRQGLITKVMLKLIGKEKEQTEIAKQKCLHIINHLRLKEEPKMGFRGNEEGFYHEGNYLYFFVQKER